MIALLERARGKGMRVTIPATAIAQAMRNPARQSRLSRLIRDVSTDLVALDGRGATEVGRLLSRTKTSDIVDAHVVVCAKQLGQPVVTSGAEDLQRLADDLRLIAV